MELLGNKVLQEFNDVVGGVFDRVMAGDKSLYRVIATNASAETGVGPAFRNAMADRPVDNRAEQLAGIEPGPISDSVTGKRKETPEEIMALVQSKRQFNDMLRDEIVLLEKRAELGLQVTKLDCEATILKAETEVKVAEAEAKKSEVEVKKAEADVKKSEHYVQEAENGLKGAENELRMYQVKLEAAMTKDKLIQYTAKQNTQPQQGQAPVALVTLKQMAAVDNLADGLTTKELQRAIQHIGRNLGVFAVDKVQEGPYMVNAYDYRLTYPDFKREFLAFRKKLNKPLDQPTISMFLVSA
jgi:hypothetical protein